MNVDKKTLALLKKNGFQWFKDNTTDRVEAICIKDILPAADGFTVVYTDSPTVVIKYSTATVQSIDIPEDTNTQWIRVLWENIVDQRKEGK